jgi:predicted ester cyclase
MSQVDGRNLVRRYLQDVFSEGRLEAMDMYLAGDAFKGRVADLVRRWRTAFPDLTETVEEVYADGDQVITVSAMSGTHEGVFESRLGPIAPTGRTVRWSRIAIRRLDGDRFVEGVFEEDEVGLLQQLGVFGDAKVPGRGRHSPLAPRD